MNYDDQLFEEMSDDQVRQVLVGSGIRIALYLLFIIAAVAWVWGYG